MRTDLTFSLKKQQHTHTKQQLSIPKGFNRAFISQNEEILCSDEIIGEQVQYASSTSL